MIDKLSIENKIDYERLGFKISSNFSYMFDLEEVLNKPYNYLFGYFENDKLLGFIHITLSIDEADIVNIAVDEYERFKGIGTKLINYVIKRFNLHALNLEVRQSNEAVKFYLKNGFKILREIPNYYNDESAYFMKKEIEIKDTYIFAIESSCDETSAAVIKNGSQVISLTIASQISTFENYGGVVPELASRMHTENINYVIDDAIKKSNMKFEDMDAIAVTYAPGLLGSLLVGVESAKVLSYVYDKPLIKVNHIAGHIYANNLEDNEIKFPSLGLVVSGGHTEIIYLKDDYNFKILGSTLDDAIGEAYDKVARVLDLKYPGGPNIERLASVGKPSYKLPIPMNDDSLNLSFSGLKSSIINLVHNEKQRGNEINKADLACSFQTTAIDELRRKVELAIKKYDIKNMIIAGGVSANSYLRETMKELTLKYNINLSIPKMLYCTDNAAMIGAAAYPLYLKKDFSDFTLNAISTGNIFKI